MNKVLILGATGNLGGLTAGLLAANPDVTLRLASSRAAGSAALRERFPKAEVVQADWYDADSLKAVVAGVDVRVIVVLVGMHGSVVVPMKSTHRQYLSRDNLSRDIQRRHQELVAAQHLDVGTLATRAEQ